MKSYLTIISAQLSKPLIKDHSHQEPLVTLQAPPFCPSPQPYSTNEHAMNIGGLVRGAPNGSLFFGVSCLPSLTKLNRLGQIYAGDPHTTTMTIWPRSPVPEKMTQDILWPFGPFPASLVYLRQFLLREGKEAIYLWESVPCFHTHNDHPLRPNPRMNEKRIVPSWTWDDRRRNGLKEGWIQWCK